MPNQPSQGEVHVNRPLTNISIAFMQNEATFIAPRVFPNIPVDKQSDLFFTFDRGFFNRMEMKPRANATESEGAGYGITTGSYFCDVFALHKDIGDQVRANYDSPLDADREATLFLSHQGLLRREVTFAANYFTNAIWTFDDAGVAATPGADQFLQWNDDASTPIEDIRTRKTEMQQSTGFRPNTMIVGQEVKDELLDHPDVIDRIKYTHGSSNPAIATDQTLAALFEVERFFTMGAIQNTAGEDLTNVHSFIGGSHALLVYSPAVPGLMTPSAGYTFSWRGLTGQAGADGQTIDRFRMRKLKADRIELEMAWDMNLVAADLGSFMLNAVA